MAMQLGTRRPHKIAATQGLCSRAQALRTTRTLIPQRMMPTARRTRRSTQSSAMRGVIRQGPMRRRGQCQSPFWPKSALPAALPATTLIVHSQISGQATCQSMLQRLDTAFTLFAFNKNVQADIAHVLTMYACVCSSASYITTAVTPRLLERGQSASHHGRSPNFLQQPAPAHPLSYASAADHLGQMHAPALHAASGLQSQDTPATAPQLAPITEASLGSLPASHGSQQLQAEALSVSALAFKPPLLHKGAGTQSGHGPHNRSAGALAPASEAESLPDSLQAAAPLVTTGSVMPHTVREIPFQALDLHEVFGEGAFGKVYRAVWQGHVVAVKVMSPEVSQRGDCVQQFRREVETMSTMSPHKHVLSMLGACTSGPHLALVTGAAR
jgi:Protein tyrosine and serine/threonine kinase